VVIDQGIDGARAIAPNDPWRSIIFLRVNTLEPIKMPPLAHEVKDEGAVALLRQWIHSLPGTSVLEPAGDFTQRRRVRQNGQSGDPAQRSKAEVRYTIDGSAPGKSAMLYTGPLELTGPATVRARAYRAGFTRSITVQETFIVAE